MKEAIKRIAERIEKTFDRIETEEATKNAFIMPFIQLLGYDIFDPEEVIPEFTADIGIKKGEKVDYAVCHDGEPAILIECKSCRADLCIDNESQLFRYFHTTKARFSVLTNGIVYKFFTDLEEPNKMDTKPFLEVNLRELDKIDFNELVKFSKNNFDEASIRDRADVLKCATSIRNVLKEELANPSEEFVRLVFRKMDCGGSMFTEKIKEKITPLVKSALETVINDKVKSHLNNALNTTEAKSEEIAAVTATPAEEVNNGIVTTQDEIDAHNIIRAILCREVPVEQIAMRDAKSYCAILYQDNNRKPICRLYFNNPERKSVGLFDGDAEDRVFIQDTAELYTLAERLKSTVAKYQHPQKENEE
ncbi:MAG: restriction endonuclease [Lentisphaeria bacterium]|nr:restriction endonuclease [Lentisphaeria bacterium]